MASLVRKCMLVVLIVALSGCFAADAPPPGHHSSSFGPPGIGYQPTGLDIYSYPTLYQYPVFR